MTETGTAWPSFEPSNHLAAAVGLFVGDPEDEDEGDEDDREEDDNEDDDEEEDGYSE